MRKFVRRASTVGMFGGFTATAGLLMLTSGIGHLFGLAMFSMGLYLFVTSRRSIKVHKKARHTTSL